MAREPFPVARTPTRMQRPLGALLFAVAGCVQAQPVPVHIVAPSVIVVPPPVIDGPPAVLVEPPRPPLAIPRPAAVTVCDPGGCWDSDARRLNQVGPLVMGP